MTWAQHRSAHQPTVIPNGWLNVGPTSLAQQAMYMPTKSQPFSIKQCIAPTLIQHYLINCSITIFIITPKKS